MTISFGKSVAILGSLSALAIAPGVAAAQKPNVLFIFTDDQRYDTIAALGNPHIVTPNLDRLARRSFVFKNAYCFGGNSGAVCIPSRNMVMSGRTFLQFERDARECKKAGKPRRKPVFTNPEWPNFPKSMKAAGYETYYREKSGSANNPDIRNHFEHRGDIHEVSALRTGRPGKGITDQAIQFLKTDRDKQRPFFMYLGYPCPHDPRWSIQKYRDLYDESKMPLPPNYQPCHEWDIGSMICRDERLEKWPRTKAAIRRHLKDYYAVISSMDYDIGRLLDTLDNLKLTDNTIIVFSSDQGIAIGSHGLMGKQNIYEDTMRVPLLFAGPGITPGKKSDALVYLHDIYPTICRMVGAPVPDGLDGRPLDGIIAGKDECVRDALMLAYTTTQRSIRDDRWKLIRFPQIDRMLLFDLEKDPRELNNLAANPEYESRVSIMMAKLKEVGKELGDTAVLNVSKPKPAEFKHPMKKLKTPHPAGGLAPDATE